MIEKIKMLLGGVLCALGALVLESLALILFSAPSNTFAMTAPPPWFMPIGVFIEEFLGLILIWRLLTNSADKSNIFLRTLFFGFGFSIPEVLLNVAGSPVLADGSLLPYLGLILIHTATAGIFGYYFSKKTAYSIGLVFFFLLAFAGHLTFNLLVLFSFDYWLIIVLPLTIIFICFIALKIYPFGASLPIQKN